MIGLLLLACGEAPAPGWTVQRALAPTMVRVDADGDGRITEPEYSALAPAGPGFAAIDVDRDGVLSGAEFQALVFTQDPLSFDDAAPREPWADADQDRTVHPDPYEQRTVRELLLVLEEIVRAADPQAALPDAPTVEAAARTRRLDSPESAQVVATIRRAADAAGVGLPASLVPAGRP